MVGLGGGLGGLIGGYLTQQNLTDIIFFIMATLGFFVSLSACLMSSSVEQGSEAVIQMGLIQRTTSNFRDICKGFGVRELYRSVLFFLILGAIIPSFSDYFYYYLIDEAGFSKMEYAMLGVLGSFCLFLGTIIYNLCLKEKSVRFMMVIACVTNLLGAGGTLLFLRQITFGMSPMLFMIVSSTVTDTLYNAFVQLPGMVLFAKLIPSNIESSMFAMLTGLMNFSNLFVSKTLGNFINSFFGVTESNLQDLWQLYAIQIGCCLLPLFFIWMLPTKEEVGQVQRNIEKMERMRELTQDEANIDYISMDPNTALRLGITKALTSSVSSLDNEPIMQNPYTNYKN